MLLEVNSNPSLSITEEHDSPTGGVEYLVSTKDEEVKRTLIRDTLILVAPKNKYTRRRQVALNISVIGCFLYEALNLSWGDRRRMGGDII